MKELTLRWKIVIGGAALLLLPFILFGVIMFRRTSNALTEISRQQLTRTTKSMASMLDLVIEKELKVTKALAEFTEIVGAADKHDQKALGLILSDIYESLDFEYEGLAVYDKHGVVYADGADPLRSGICIVERDYFAQAKKGFAGVGPVVTSKATGRTVFALSVPIYSEDGTFLGGMLAILDADFLLSYVATMKIGHTGYAFLVDQSGNIKATIKDEVNDLVCVQKHIDALSLIRLINRRETGVFEYAINGVEKVAGVSPVYIPGWAVVVTQDKHEVMEVAYANIHYLIILSILVVFPAAGGFYFFSKGISRKVQARLYRFSQAVAQSNEAFIVIDSKKRIDFCNDAAASLVGNDIEIDEPASFDGMDAPLIENAIDEVRLGKSWNGRIKVDSGSKGPLTYEVSITPIREDNGDRFSSLIIAHDITAELLLQEQVLQSQKMEAMGTLAGGIAHDFNNILSAVLGYSELALYTLDDPESLSSYLMEITRASMRARDLVNQILTFSRKNHHKLCPMVVKYVIKDALSLVRASLPAMIEIQQDIRTGSQILGDPTQMHQLMMNLCTNAGYAMRGRTGVLKVGLYDISKKNDKAYVQLVVSDTGIGMPPDVIEKMYDPFYTTKPTGAGTGLGLSVVHGIVKSVHGDIFVETGPGRGTTFRIDIPRLETELEVKEEEAFRKFPSGSEHILLIDDEPAIIESTKARLRKLGYRVTAYRKSADALEAFTNDPAKFKLVLTDYTMPDLTGVELIKGIRCKNNSIPVLICSGYMKAKEEIESIERVLFIKKPVITYELAVALRTLLDECNLVKTGILHG